MQSTWNILELKDKLKPDELINDENVISTEESALEDDYALKVSEVLGALLALGYSEKEANMAIKNIDKSNTVEIMIKDSLRVLMGQVNKEWKELLHQMSLMKTLIMN